MRDLKRKLMNFVTKIYVNTVGNSLRQSDRVDTAGGRLPAMGVPELLRRAAEEGAVLLKNDGALPLSGKVALFGRVQIDCSYAGCGSGGDVLKPYRVSILEGLSQNPMIDLDEQLKARYEKFCLEHPADRGYWGNWTNSFPEMPLTKEEIKEISLRAGTAVVVIGRCAGEEADFPLKKGGYYLTDDERALLSNVSSCFSKTIVLLNISNPIDLGFLDEFEISSLLVLFQGGMEMGNAAARLLAGNVNPCGKLSMTLATEYRHYPSSKNFGNAKASEYCEDIYVGYRHFETFAKQNVRFPFGFGLSYTSFEIEGSFNQAENAVHFTVTNVGTRAGKDVVQIYVEKPQGRKGNPARELIGFHKTELLSSFQKEEGTIQLSDRDFCSYDETRSCFVRLKGEYKLYCGNNVRDAKEIASFSFEEEKIVEQCFSQCAPKEFFLIKTKGPRNELPRFSDKDLKKEIFSSLPPALPFTGSLGYKLTDVKLGKISLEDFVSQLDLKELAALSRGDLKMNSALGPAGNAGVLGGVLPSLREKGVPPVTAVDGPSGVRLKTSASLIPCATLLACTFDKELLSNVYEAVGEEMKERGADVLLAPAMNIQRSPLGGRNFEYFSEDPFLSGKMAAAAVRGLQKTGVAACPKHFACNNQEYDRKQNDSRVSERALREIYLRGFEICVKEGKPKTLMTSYNKLNGVWTHYNYELVRGILREEWGFSGCVMTDWWMKNAKSPEFPKIKNNAYRVRAGVNVLMPGGDVVFKRFGGSLLRSLGKEGGITLGELQKNAMEVLGFVLESHSLEKYMKFEREKQK